MCPQYQLSIAPQLGVGLINPSPDTAGISTGLIVCWSYVYIHWCCKLVIAMDLSFPGHSIVFSKIFDSYKPHFAILPEPSGKGNEIAVTFVVQYSTDTVYIWKVASFFISHHPFDQRNVLDEVWLASIFISLDRVSLCSPNWSRTHRNLSAFTPWILGLKPYATPTPSPNTYKLILRWKFYTISI